MATEISVLPGPLTSEMTRSHAEAALRNHPDFPKNASVQLEPVEGRWVAAIVKQTSTKQAGPFDGAPADASEEAPGPKSEGPDDTAPAPDDGSDGPPSPDGPPAPDDGGGDEGEDKGKGGEKHEIKQMFDLVTQIAQALGIPPAGPDDSMVPGADDGMGGPPGAGGPPPGPPGMGGPPGPPDTQKMIHEKALKPGETPPGGTPLGAPAFASTKPQIDPRHPWAHMVGKLANWEVEDRIGDRPLPEVYSELQHLASEIGYGVEHFGESRDEQGHRTARAQISVYAQ